MSALYALYPNPDSAQAAVDNLRAAGVDDRDITVISPEPFDEYESSRRDGATWLYWSAGVGGALGLCAGYLLTTLTQRAWPLVTGGMPIVAPWPNLVVMFELTMLGGILATVITLVVEARIARRQPALYDPGVSDGNVLVGIANPPAGDVESVRAALLTNPAVQIKTL